MTIQTSSYLPAIVDRIVQTVQPEEVILFGSLARGDGDEFADVDLLVIESGPFGEARSRAAEIGRIERALGAIPAPADILVYSRDEVQRFRHARNHIVCKALEEGKVLYARS